MYYEINVSRNGKHLFATHQRSLLTEKEAKALFFDMKRAFPDCQITCSRYEACGRELNWVD